MDPKTTTSLDPKLKDMYNRVMNTPIPPPVSPSPIQGDPADPTIPPQPETNVSPSAPVPPLQPEVPMPTPVTQPEPTPIESGQTTEVHATMPLPQQPPRPVSAVVVGGSQSHGGKSFLPILLGFGAIIFFAVYAIFWVKFFNLSVPFLPF